MNSVRKYLYGLIEESSHKKFEIPGLDAREVFTINRGSLAVVASDFEGVDADPTRRNIRIHAEVQERLLNEYTLLPMSFGVVAHDEREAALLLEKNQKALLLEFQRLRGMIEVAVRGYWNQETIKTEIEEKHKEISRLKARIAKAASAPEAQNLLMEAGMLVEKLLEDWKSKCAGKIYMSLNKLAVNSYLGNISGIKNIINASFLVKRSGEEAFKSELYRLDGEFEGKIDFKYVAPLPPYTFLNIALERH